MTFGFEVLLGSFGVGFDSFRFLFVRISFAFDFGFDSILGKIWVLVRFVLAGFGYFPISKFLLTSCFAP